MAEIKIDVIAHGAEATPPSDATPPFVTAQNPAPLDTEVSVTGNIFLRVDDSGDGVDLSTVLIEIDRGSGYEVAYSGALGGFQSGFTGPGSTVIAGGINGYDFTIDPNDPLPEFTNISVRVNATDLAILQNVMTTVIYGFESEDNTAPQVSNRVPPPGEQDDALESTLVSFRVDDTNGSGVDQSTINVQIQNGPGQPLDDAIIGGVFQAPYDGGSSAISAFGPTGYNVVIDRTSDYITDDTVSITLTVADNQSNVLNISWGFSTANPPPPPPPEPIAQTILGFPLDMYRFIIYEIRRQDLFGSPRPGTLFLKRYLDGPNQLWQQNILFVQSIPDLWDVFAIADDKLQFLKNIVGWTNETLLKKITDSITDAQLRRLIAVSGSLWKTRGTEDSILNILRLLTITRLRIWNWFDFRWVLGETELGEEHEGTDPWVIDLPSSVEQEFTVDESTLGNTATGSHTSVEVLNGVVSEVKSGDIFIVRSGFYNGYEAKILGVQEDVPVAGTDTLTFVQSTDDNEFLPSAAYAGVQWEIIDRDYQPDDVYRSNLRIVDNGTLDRVLVKRILQLMKPSLERFDITYLSFLDLFQVVGDDQQWDITNGNLDVRDGYLNMEDSTTAESTYSIVTEAANWTEYVLSARIKGTSEVADAEFAVQFYRVDEDNYYECAVDTVDQEITFRKVIAGVPTVIGTADLDAVGFPWETDLFYLMRISVVSEGLDNRIQLFIDGFQLIDQTDGDLSQGSIGFRHDVDAFCVIDEVEVIELSQGTDNLGINESP